MNFMLALVLSRLHLATPQAVFFSFHEKYLKGHTT